MFRTFPLIMLMLAAAPTAAQVPVPPPANPTVPMASPKGASPPPEKLEPPNSTDRLSEQKGTIVPPNVDQGMQVKPPRNSGARMPVIPPPGSPGGNRSVVPK